MQFVSRATQISALALGIAGALASGQTYASGFQLKENSVKATGRAYAGSAAAAGDASVVINNPAAMTLFDTTTVQADVHAIDLSYELDSTGTDAFGRPLNGGDGGNAGGVAAVPATSAIIPVGDTGLTFGAAISAPFGLKTEYDRDWRGRYHAVESDVKIVDLTLALSLDLTDRFSVGAGAIIEHAEVTLSNAIDFGSSVCRPSAATGGLPPPFCLPLGSNTYGPQRNDGFAEINGEDTSFGWTAGLHWRPTDNLSIGFSHRSEIDHELEGEADFTVPANVTPILAVGAPNQFIDTDVVAKLTTPSITTLSAAWQVTDAFALMADVSATDWHSLREINIDYQGASRQPNTIETFDWEDTLFYSIGAEYALSDAFTLRAGLAYDETPVQDEHRSPRLPDNDRNWYSVGLTWNASEAMEISAAYTRIMVDDPELDIVSSSGSRLVGEAEGHANLFGISAQYRF
jgi:long-chain fatty acid transport protein